MCLLPLLLAVEDFEKNEQDIFPLDTADSQDVDDTGAETDTDDTNEDTASDTGSEDTDSIIDSDGDGFSEDEDCDDNDPTYNPDAPDDENDGEDQNCDGVPDDNYVDPSTTDDDGDGYSEAEGDCDDDDISLNQATRMKMDFPVVMLTAMTLTQHSHAMMSVMLSTKTVTALPMMDSWTNTNWWNVDTTRHKCCKLSWPTRYRRWPNRPQTTMGMHWM